MVEFIKVYKDGDCWGAFTRENIAEGECAFADTPHEAYQTLFDELRIREWKHKKEAYKEMIGIMCKNVTDEKICPFMSRCEIQPDGDHLLATTYCQKDRCMAWEPHNPVDEYDTFKGGRCRLIL